MRKGKGQERRQKSKGEKEDVNKEGREREEGGRIRLD
jgi:hypothetical protein